MKKGLIVVFLLVAVLMVSAAAFAEDQSVVSVKIGYNAVGVEYERLGSNGIGFFVSETTYRRDSYFDDIYGWDYWYAYTTLFGMRKHTSLNANHMFMSGAIGLSGIDPAIDASVGYEFKPSFLPDFLIARAEAGASLVLDWSMELDPVIHVGVGVGYKFDWDVFNYFF